MLLLSLLWLAPGAIIGLIAVAARLQPATWRALRMSGLGMIIALVTGWLGTWLQGKYFATPMVCWITVIGVIIIPHALRWLSSHTPNSRHIA
jgi:hypothetical protein